MPRKSQRTKNPKRVKAGKNPTAKQKAAQEVFSYKTKRVAMLMKQGMSRKQAWAELRNC